MLEVADISRLHGAAYRARYGDRLLPSQARAMQDIQACRTAYFGGHVKQCDHCGEKVYVYHSCGNRHCPKCHGEQTGRWLDRQRARLLPCSYYLVTFTLPDELRPLARGRQKKVYGLLMRCAAAALQSSQPIRATSAADSAASPCCKPGRKPCSTTRTSICWLLREASRPMVQRGSSRKTQRSWSRSTLLSVIFRAKICAALKKAGLLQEVPSKVWKKNWVVHCQPAGSGQKVLDYLGRYVFRLAISNSRLEQIDRGHVTFPYRDNRSHQMRRVTLQGEEFIVASSSMCSPAVAPTCDTMASAAVPVASNWIKPKLYSTLHNPRQSMIPYWMLPSLSCLPLRQPAAPTAKSAS